MSDVNIPLLRKCVEWAEAEAMKPIELCEWNQLDWIADDTEQRMARLRVQEGEFFTRLDRALAIKAPECGTCYCIAGYITHEIVGEKAGAEAGVMFGASRAIVAANALGISKNAAEPLFRADNTIEDVRRIAESIAGEKL